MSRTTKTIIWLIVILVVIAGIWWGVSNRKPREEAIKIGAILPLTGGASIYGESAKEGVDLAIEEMNNKGGINGRKIEIIYEDSKAEPKEGVSAINKLITVDKVPVIIGAMTSSVTLAVAPIAEENQVVLLSPGSSAPKITKAGDYIFRNEVSEEFGARKSAEFYYDAGFKEIAILYINNDYGVSVKETTKKVYQEKGGKISTAEAFVQKTTDFRTSLQKIKNSKPQALLIVAHEEYPMIIRQMKEVGMELPILTTPVFESKELLNKLGELAEGVIYSCYSTFDLESQKEEVKQFLDNFRKKYSKDPSYYAALGYDAAYLLKIAIEKGGYHSDGIKNALYTIEDYPGVSGITSFDENGDVIKPVILKTVKNGKFVVYEE